MDAAAVAAALEDARFNARQASRQEDLAADERRRAEPAEWERIDRLLVAVAPDAGESPGQISQDKPPAAFENITPDSDGYLSIKQDQFHESFAQDLSEEEALVMAVTQKAPLRATFGDTITAPAWRVKPT
ncbi:hypothetical protein QWJ26_02920 [Streptomyces sp. CSDS2]|nr:hypothetical protein [Streptomyces sp. CSDS2]MDN3258775.1 hypothetical protein [Streptomyces sp. CSDS2]